MVILGKYLSSHSRLTLAMLLWLAMLGKMAMVWVQNEYNYTLTIFAYLLHLTFFLIFVSLYMYLSTNFFILETHTLIFEHEFY